MRSSIRWPAVKAVVAFGHRPLYQDGTFDRIDDAAELRQQAIAHQLEDAAAVLGDLRLEQLLAVRPQAVERPRFVLLHEAAVADHVGGEDGREPAFHSQASPGAPRVVRIAPCYP